MDAQTLVNSVLAIHSSVQVREKSDRPSISVPAEALLSVMHRLRDEPTLSFDMLCAHTAIDWVSADKLELIYQLYSLKYRHYLMVSVLVSRKEPVVSSVSKLWQIAEWQEREVFDMFGVLYQDHSDLRRILLEDDWSGFPLRKDYKDDFMLERPR